MSSTTKKLNPSEQFLLLAIHEKPGITSRELYDMFKQKFEGGQQSMHLIETRKGLIDAGLVNKKPNDFEHTLSPFGESWAAMLSGPAHATPTAVPA